MSFSHPKLTSENQDMPPFTSIKEEIDWTNKGAVGPVMNSGSMCPASWAQSATGTIEGLQAITSGNFKAYSVQQIIDCSG